MIHASTSDDVHAQADLLEGWNQSYVQLSAGPFAGTLVETKLDSVSVFAEYTSQMLLQKGSLAKDVVAVGIPVKMPGTAVFCGGQYRESAVYIFSGSHGFEFLSPAGLVMSGVVVCRKALFEVLTADERPLVAARLDRAHLANVDGSTPIAMRDFIMAVLELSRSAQDIVSLVPLRQSLQQSIVANLAQLLANCEHGRDPVIRLARRWKIVLMAKDIALAPSAGPTGIADLCRALGVSRRTLQYCFHDVIGLSPVEFLRVVRLNGVRRTLRTAPSVTQAAAQWGFWHLGYFSRDYRKMFGELPSQTFRRYQKPKPF
jgi:AraC family transcriptional regulator, ethanolamine operon transcriptional activator